MPYSGILERWDKFLLTIDNRFHEQLTQAATVLPSLLDLQEFNTQPFGTAWQGIESQMKELIAKIDDTWYEKVSPAFDEIKDKEEEAICEADGDLEAYHAKFYPMYYAALEKGRALQHHLEKALKKYQVDTFAEAARKLTTRASQILAGNFCCSQCKAPLPVQQQFYRSYYQVCDYCQIVNTFEPGTIARNVEHFALHPLAEEAALEEYFRYWDMEYRFRSQRDDEPQEISGEELMTVFKVFAEKYLKARISIIPDYQQQYEKDLAAKIEHVKKYVINA
ncbi:MAG: hypothetical protein J7578_15530 [Chitinophagaceae bacterium]|nr:hypothetical protein [Chitinophagaceae bacterium]